jgi:amino acid transporter
MTTFQAVLKHVGSPAASLMVWAGTGVVSFLGALCYSELALLLPESGSDYTYIKRGISVSNSLLKNVTKFFCLKFKQR